VIGSNFFNRTFWTKAKLIALQQGSVEVTVSPMQVISK